MLKVLVVDFLFVEAHRVANINFIEAIATSAKTTVFSANGYYKNNVEPWREKNINVIEVGNIPVTTGKFSSRIRSLKLMYRAAQIVKSGYYDLVVCEGFEILSFALGYKFFNNIPVALFHHKNIDELVNPIKLQAFNFYKNKVYHFVFEKFFKEYMINIIGIPKNNIMVIPHPVPNLSEKQNDIYNDRLDCVGLCNSNSEQFINQVKAKNDILSSHHLKLLLRSQEDSVNLSNVTIIKGYLEENIYRNYIRIAKSVLVPIPDTYVYRLSGSIYDALAQRRIVFTTSKYYGQHYRELYPGICIYVKNVDDFINKLIDLDRITNVEKSFDKFICEHSMEQVSQKLENTIDVIVHNVHII